VHSLVDLAKKSKFQIVASGIEDAEQRHRLQLEEVGLVRASYFPKLIAAEIDRYLEDFSIFSGSLFEPNLHSPLRCTSMLPH